MALNPVFEQMVNGKPSVVKRITCSTCDAAVIGSSFLCVRQFMISAFIVAAHVFLTEVTAS